MISTDNIQVQLAPQAKKVKNDRRELFQSLIDQVKDVEVVSNRVAKDKVSYRFYFDLDIFSDPKKVNENPSTSVSQILEFQKGDTSKAILDITKDYFEDEVMGAVLTLCSVCASFITCASAELQETIYLHTGRLAHIINDPIAPHLFQEPDTDALKNSDTPSLVWFGSVSEIFSILEFENKNKDYNIKQHNLSNNPSSKTLVKVVSLADIVVLPKTFDYEGEESRFEKVKYCLLLGKFVVAPDLLEERQPLAFNGTLPEAIEYFKTHNITEWILEKQGLLQQQESLERSVEQMSATFDLVPEESLLEDLDYFLETEEIQL